MFACVPRTLGTVVKCFNHDVNYPLVSLLHTHITISHDDTIIYHSKNSKWLFLAHDLYFVFPCLPPQTVHDREAWPSYSLFHYPRKRDHQTSPRVSFLTLSFQLILRFSVTPLFYKSIHLLHFSRKIRPLITCLLRCQ